MGLLRFRTASGFWSWVRWELMCAVEGTAAIAFWRSGERELAELAGG